jgi:O-antigen/teichoic acid export membrane protein
MKKNTITSGAVWNLGAQLVEVVMGIILLIVATRILGPENYGIYQTILAIIILSMMISDFGISASVSRFIAENIENHHIRNEFVTSGGLIKLIFMLFITIVLFSLIPKIELFFNIELEKYKIYIVIIVLLRSIREFFSRICQGIRRLDIRAKMNSLYSLLSAALTIFFLFIGFDVNAILIAEIIVSVFIIFYFIYNIRSIDIKLSITNEKNIFFSIIRYSIPMFLTGLSFYIYTKSDVLMIQFFIDEKAVGLYALATMIISKVSIPLVSIGQSAGPAFSTLKNIERMNSFLKVFKMTLVLSVPISLGVFLVADLLIIQIFGIEYHETISILKLLCIFLFFNSINSVMSPILDYMGYAKRRSILVGISAVLNILLNILFIPKFGIIGAVYSTLFTYTLYGIVLNLNVIKISYHSNLQFIKDSRSFLFKLFLSSMTMFIVVYLLKCFLNIDDLLKLVTLVGSGIITYVFMLKITNVFSINEIPLLMKKKKLTK